MGHFQPLGWQKRVKYVFVTSNQYHKTFHLSYYTSFKQTFGVTNLTKSEIILGCITLAQQNSTINHILLEVKYYIYVCKLEKFIPLYNSFENRLKITENIKKQIAIKTKKVQKHTHKWHHIRNYLLN